MALVINYYFITLKEAWALKCMEINIKIYIQFHPFFC